MRSTEGSPPIAGRGASFPINLPNRESPICGQVRSQLGNGAATDFFSDREAYLILFKERYPKELEVLQYEKRGKLEDYIENVVRGMPKSGK